jgi:hypothetical protein
LRGDRLGVGFLVMQDWQTYSAVSVVAIAVVTLSLSAWRRMRRSPGAGCGGSCGCVKTELRGK